MNEPIVSQLAGEGRIASRAQRFRRLREEAPALPRYGRRHPEIDAFGDEFLRRVADTVVAVFTDPALPIARVDDLLCEEPRAGWSSWPTRSARRSTRSVSRSSRAWAPSRTTPSGFSHPTRHHPRLPSIARCG
jgi:hypothetical protein